jgi:hypothetical protein
MKKANWTEAIGIGFQGKSEKRLRNYRSLINKFLLSFII